MYKCISGQDSVSRARMVSLPCWHFELSPWNKLYRGQFVRLITLIPSRYFDDTCIWYTYMPGRDNVSHATLLPFRTLQGKLPYLLAVTLSIISSNIYTRLAVCNCLSFTFRSGDLPSLLMAIFITFVANTRHPNPADLVP